LKEANMQTLKYFGVILTAGLVGAAVALLLAPASGEETRRRLTRTMEDEKRRMVKRINREKAQLVKRGRQKLEEVTEYVNDEFEAAQKKIAKVVPL
jgi:gas vesicle protein